LHEKNESKKNKLLILRTSPVSIHFCQGKYLRVTGESCMKRSHSFHYLASISLVALCITVNAQTAGSSAPRPIHVGQLASVTNPLTSAMAGEYMAGIALAFNRVNTQGGVKGRLVVLVTKDDNFDAANAVAMTEQLVAQEDIVAMVGNFGTQPLLKLASEGTLEKHQLASIAPMTGLQSALNKPNVFALRASYEDEVLAMFNHASRVQHSKVAYIYFEAGVGTHLAKLAPDMAAQSRVELIGPKGFAVTADKTIQESTVLDALKTFGDNRPQAVVLIAVGGVHSAAVKALRKHYGSTMPIYSLGQVSSEALIKDVGNVAASGVMLTQVVPEPGKALMPVMREFHADLKKFGQAKPPSYMLLEGYLAGRVTAQLLMRSKTISRQMVLESAKNAGEVNIGGYRVVYSPDQRKSLYPIELTMITQSGKLIR
jgi:branched-chain amino acid transport system substrate-binding protein